MCTNRLRSLGNFCPASKKFILFRVQVAQFFVSPIHVIKAISDSLVPGRLPTILELEVVETAVNVVYNSSTIQGWLHQAGSETGESGIAIPARNRITIIQVFMLYLTVRVDRGFPELTLYLRDRWLSPVHFASPRLPVP